MKKSAILVLRLGLGIAFVWTGVSILLQPSVWASLLQPWAMIRIFGSLKPLMQVTAVLDILIGASLVLNLWAWVASLVGAVALVLALIGTRIGSGSALNILFLAAFVALFLLLAPAKVLRKFGIRR
ncbi:MAG: hypothetical protein WCS85_04030 [Candidatus Peribacteraceae bacterium]